MCSNYYRRKFAFCNYKCKKNQKVKGINMKSIVVSKQKFDFEDFVESNRQFIYLLLIYIAGVLAGSLLFRSLELSKFSNFLSDFLTIKSDSLLSVVIDRLSVYLLVYTVTILLGLCIIGFPIINAVPFLCGFEIALKIAFYYNMYSLKGIGYSLLMIVPEASAFMVILFFTIASSKELSKNIFDISLQKNTEKQLILKDYLKSFLIYGAGITAISFVNSLIIFLLNSIIKM